MDGAKPADLNVKPELAQSLIGKPQFTREPITAPVPIERPDMKVVEQPVVPEFRWAQYVPSIPKDKIDEIDSVVAAEEKKMKGAGIDTEKLKKEMGLGPLQWKMFCESLASPKLLAQDKELFQKYLKALTGDGSGLSVLTEKISGRIADVFFDALEKYSGKEDPGKRLKNFDAMFELVTYFTSREQAQMLSGLDERISKLLTEQNKSLFNFINNRDLKRKEKVREILEAYKNAFNGGIFGTRERADNFRAMSMLNMFALLKDVDQTAMSFDKEFGKYEDIKEIATRILSLSNEANSASKLDDYAVRGKFLEDYQELIGKYYAELCKEKPDHERVRKLGMIAAQSDELFFNLSILFKERDKIISIVAKNFPSVKSDQKHSVFVCATSALPDKVIGIDIKGTLEGIKLEDGTTLLDYVKSNSRFIVFSDDYKDDESRLAFIGGGSAGCYAGAGVIMINAKALKALKDTGKIKTELVMILSHETRHAADDRRLSVDSDARFSTITELNAYKFELKIMQQLMTADEREHVEALVKGAGEIVALFKQGHDIDLNVYPTKTPAFIAFEMTSRLSLAGIISKKERNGFQAIFDDALLGKVKLEDVADKRFQDVTLKIIYFLRPVLAGKDYKSAIIALKTPPVDSKAEQGKNQIDDNDVLNFLVKETNKIIGNCASLCLSAGVLTEAEAEKTIAPIYDVIFNGAKLENINNEGFCRMFMMFLPMSYSEIKTKNYKEAIAGLIKNGKTDKSIMIDIVKQAVKRNNLTNEVIEFLSKRATGGEKINEETIKIILGLNLGLIDLFQIKDENFRSLTLRLFKSSRIKGEIKNYNEAVEFLHEKYPKIKDDSELFIAFLREVYKSHQ
ncbi:MAG: hypothetical protein NTZ10_07045 [Candidatus Saganbacteria bacterium]|nr:hypothetical protein [Candidatus Saganbacteria bacterium]